MSVAANPKQVKSMTTRGGRSTKDPPYTKDARRPAVIPPVVEEENNIPEQVIPEPVVDTVFGHVSRIGRVWIGKKKAIVTGLRESYR